MPNKSLSTDLSTMDAEQLPVAKHKLHGWKHFAGLYAGEHVAATEFVIGATFVALGAKTKDILLGLLIGNLLAVLSWTLITSPIAVETRLSLYAYLNKIAGNTVSKLYNWANVLIFTVISAAMVTVSSSAVRFAFKIPAQLNWYPTNLWFVLIVIIVGIVVVIVSIYGFDAVAKFSNLCAPWLFTMFISGALVLFPALSLNVLGNTLPSSWNEFIVIGDQNIWTGVTATGEPGLDLFEVIGFAWAANTITHFGLIDMALLRFAKKKSYGLATSTGMLFGHYIAWISAGIMGAGTAVILGKSITELDPGDVAFYALGWSGFIIVIIAGWTTAITNLYRAGLATQAIFTTISRSTATMIVGIAMIFVACFPFVFTQILPLLTYAGLIVVPIGAIVFAEHQIFPKIGLTRYWLFYQKKQTSIPAVISWMVGLIFGFGLNMLNVISFYYLPTWVLTIIVYTLLSKNYGANESYPKEEQENKSWEEAVETFQEKQKKEAQANSILVKPFYQKIMNTLAYTSLAITIFLALKTFMYSPTRMDYELNKELFYTYGLICTLIYFATTYLSYTNKEKNA
jgi:purine-cytosine permease-like protein